MTAREKLAAWIRAEDHKMRKVARMIGCSPAPLRAWLAGKQTPLPIYRAAIERVTGGAVKREDW